MADSLELDPIRGRFRCDERERDYRGWQLPQDRRQALIALGAVVLVIVAYVPADVLAHGSGPTLTALLAMRAMLAVLLLALALLLNRVERPEDSEP